MHKIRRRDFLRTGVGTAVAMGAPCPLTACQGFSEEPSSETNAKVAAIRGKNLDAMTRDAVEALGGMRSVVNKGETVFIKPVLTDPIFV